MSTRRATAARPRVAPTSRWEPGPPSPTATAGSTTRWATPSRRSRSSSARGNDWLAGDADDNLDRLNRTPDTSPRPSQVAGRAPDCGSGRASPRRRAAPDVELSRPSAKEGRSFGERGEPLTGWSSGFDLAFKAYALSVGTPNDGVDGLPGWLRATKAAVTRFRGGWKAQGQVRIESHRQP